MLAWSLKPAISPLDRKLIRDLWRLRGQVLAIALVIASGVAVLVMSRSSLEALQSTAEAYYQRYGFAEVFADLKRAPERMADRAAAIAGVRTVETRIVHIATLDLEGFPEPIVGKLVSMPERKEALLNRLAIRSGRGVAPGRPDEVVVSEPLAEAHGLALGDRISVIMNGRKRDLDIVGTALSPEFVYAIGPGALVPDDMRFGVLWMGRTALQAAYDLEGAFNNISLSLLPDADPAAVIERLDRLLDRYGGLGAIERADQLSNWFLMNEIDQLATMATVLPGIFLIVAAFLANIVLSRLIATERSEIGLLKAFGYSNFEIAWHYTKLVVVKAALGILLGWLIGSWLGRINTEIYADFYRFPLLLFRPSSAAFAIGAGVSLAAALVGSLGAVVRAATLPPAEAMRPQAPPTYRRSGPALAWLETRLDQATRIILRDIMRWPLRSFLTSVGIALSVGVMIMALQWNDAINHLAEVYFHQGQRQDLTVGLVEPQSSVALGAFARMPGVLAAEPGRSVGAILRAGPRQHRGAVQGLPANVKLQPIFDVRRGNLPVPAGGIVLGTTLAEKLAVGIGDLVTLEILEGRRPIRQVPVAGLVETYIGMPATMDLSALNRLMRERPSLSHAHLLVDPRSEAALFATLKDLPQIGAVTSRRSAISEFHETVAQTILIFIGFFTAFACTLAFGVVYNSARISLSERGRDLATLRVLGFSRLEVAYILLGEIALLILFGLPLGCLVGSGLAWLMTTLFETELYRVPLVIERATYGWALVVALAAAAASIAIIRRRLDHLDLMAVLKTRE